MVVTHKQGKTLERKMQKPLAIQLLNTEVKEEVEEAEEVTTEAMLEVVEEDMTIKIIITVVVAEAEEEDMAAVVAAVANTTMKVSNGISHTLKIVEVAIRSKAPVDEAATEILQELPHTTPTVVVEEAVPAPIMAVKVAEEAEVVREVEVASNGNIKSKTMPRMNNL